MDVVISALLSIETLINAAFNLSSINNYVIPMNRLEKVQGQLSHPRKFEYTVDGGCLTLEQREFYEENGFLVIRKFLKDDSIEKWKKRFIEYCDKKVDPLPGMQIVRDISLVKAGGKNAIGEAAITKVQDFQDDEELYTFCNNPDMVPYLKSFCGPNIKSVHTMFINKPPFMGSSSRHPFHQDLAYFPFRPANRIVAAWASLEDATKENGSLNIFPKTHKGEFLRHIYPEWEGKVNKAYFGIDNYDQAKFERIDLEMKKGDIVFFHPLLIHGSGENKTTGYRKVKLSYNVVNVLPFRRCCLQLHRH